MATVHSMSMLTNSCVKPPLNPRTGIPYAQYERSNGAPASEWVSDPIAGGDTVEMSNGSVNFGAAQTDTLQQDMTDLPDDMFYQRLLKLKEEHKKTLELCETIYNTKMATTRSRSPSPMSRSINTPTRSISPAPRSRSPLPRSFSPGLRSPSPVDSTHSLPVTRSLPPSRLSKSGGSDPFGTSPIPRSKDMVRDMSASKPPLPKRCSGSPHVRPSSASGVRSSQAWSKDSTSSSIEDMLRSANGTPVNSQSGDIDVKALLDESHQSALSKIEDMWENFSVDEYTPRSRRESGSMRRRSNSLSRLSDTQKEAEEWRHRITVPQPFSMTKREEAKEPKKSRAAMELAEKRAEEERIEEEECQKKFKAKPVPAHVYMPLYNEIVEEQETRRRYNRQKSAEFTKSIQKPFKLSTREEEMRQKVKRASQFQEVDDTPKKEFRAKPFPDHLFGYTVYDKLSEEEEYRRIRAQMRSKELLQKSSLPPNMASRGQDYIHGKSRQKANARKAKKARKAGLVEEFKFKPRVNDDIPNFDDLHRRFLSELGRKKAAREATVCKPFNLRTSRIPSTKHKIYEDIARDEAQMKASQWKFKSGRSTARTPRGMTNHLSTSWDSIPAKMTTSAQLRTSANKQKLQQKMEEEVAMLETERRKRMRARQLQKEVTERALANDHTGDLTQAKLQKIREHRAAERAQHEEYERYLNEIHERVEKRPLLFEQTAQENARRAAEKKYQATLLRTGVADMVHTPTGSASRSRTISRSSHQRSPSGSRSRSRSPTTYSRSMGTAKYSDDFDDTHASDVDARELSEGEE